jgi:Recombination endonuclease VII
MPYRDPQKRKEFMRSYYQQNSGIIKERSRKTRERLSLNPSYQAEKYQRYLDYEKRSKLLRRYGLTVEDYDQMLENQEHRCGICLTHKDELKKGLCVDHCHRTGKVRMLLCVSCNTGLGQFRDSTENLSRAIKYLKEFSDA